MYNVEMKIGLNGQNLTSQENAAGPEKYTFNLYKAIIKQSGGNEVIIYTEHKQNLADNTKFIKKKLSWTQISLALELINNPVDVFFSPIHTFPVLAQIFSPRTKFYIMIHGLEYLLNKNYKTPFFKQLTHPFILWWVCATSKKIIVPSYATKNSILEKNWLFVNSEKIEVVYEGLNDNFLENASPSDGEILTKYEITNDYLIFVSTIQPRKNIPGLVKAFAKVIKENQEYANLKLVIVGRKGWNFTESMEAPGKYGIDSSVIFAGRVPDNELPALVRNSNLYVNFSFEEGFGLTVLEAMASGVTPVISNIPAHREVASDSAYYSDPFTLQEMSDNIIRGLKEPIEKSKLLARANLFSWDKCAKQILAIFAKS